MRVNIYAEEMPETPRLEIIEKVIEGHAFTALRIYLELPATVPADQVLLDRATSKPVQPQEVQAPFMHRDGDDDSAAVTFWGKRDLRVTLRRALDLLDEHYAKKGRDPLRNNPVVGFMSEEQAEGILAEVRATEWEKKIEEALSRARAAAAR